MAAEQSQLSKILQKNKIELADLQRKSRSWFEQQVLLMANVRKMRPETLMRGDQSNKSMRILPGTMVMFIYDPKTKDTLPYWDRFPLVLPFRTVPGGFYGLNLHYLPYQYRARLLDMLMAFATDRSLDEQTRLKFSWRVIGNASKFAIVHPCVKHYLYDHVRTPFKAIDPQDWPTALVLPVEQFQKATAGAVWNDSKQMIRRNT